MMMQQATALAAASHGIDLVALEGQVRKAKAEGRTVTAVNGCIYIDYQLVARIPPGIEFRTAHKINFVSRSSLSGKIVCLSKEAKRHQLI
ncbi:unnamed protein product [Gongylonema pulchrum]|uniref:Uncharacterized protein n=1 Tax=Gongylonema pulchrum TaxID=637853 RepID=A0A183D4L2_9BILA|nr:unnamed protein product [Gongylonema pulchrum]